MLYSENVSHETQKAQNYTTDRKKITKTHKNTICCRNVSRETCIKVIQ